MACSWLLKSDINICDSFVFFVVKIALGVATERKRRTAEKNCIKLSSDRKELKGAEWAESMKTISG